MIEETSDVSALLPAKTKHRIGFLYGYLGTNIGDVAVTQGALQLVKQAGFTGSAVFVAPPLARVARMAWQGILEANPEIALIEWDFRKAQKSLSELGLGDIRTLVYPGGEHLFSYGTDNDEALSARLAVYFDALENGKKYIVLPSTFGPFHTAKSREMVARFLNSASIVLTRDARSLKHIEPFGVHAAPGLDPAFFIAPPLAEDIPDKIANVVMRLDGMGLRPGSEASKTTQERLATEGYGASTSYRLHRDVALELLRQGFSVRVLVQCLADEKPGEFLHSELAADFPERVQILKPVDATTFTHELANGAITITSRFHSAIFSMLAGRPPVGIYFDEHGHKMPGLFESFGIDNLCPDSRSTGDIVRAAISAHTNRHLISERVRHQIGVMRDSTVASLRGHLV